MSIIHEALRRARRRMILASLLRNAVWSGLAVSLVTLLLASGRLLAGRPPFDITGLLLAALGAALLTFFLTFRQRPDLRAAALRLDTLGQTRDRFTSGLALDDAQTSDPLQQLAIEDCHAFASHFNARPLLPVRVPRTALALTVPAVAMAFLFLQYRAAQQLDPATLAAQQELAQKADELEQLQKKIAEAAAEDPRLRELAQAVQEAIEHLDQAAQSREADARDAMKELSAIEAMIAAMQKALAAQAEAMRHAAERAEAGDPAATDSAAQAAAQAPMTGEERQQMDEALSEARAAGQMDEAARQQALQKLAEQLRRMAENQGAPREGAASQRQLQSAMNSLQNIKYGEGSGQPKPREDDGRGNQRTMVEAFSGPGDKSGESQTPSEVPSGQPGSESDQGITESPFGQQAKTADPLGEGTRLNSILSEGESLADLVPAVGDTSKSTRRYRELYNAVAADAQNTVDREDIPLASRFFIKRYFENIRPTE